MTRKEKIEFLKMLEAGTITISDLLPKSVVVIYYPDNTFRFSDSDHRINEDTLKEKIKNKDTVLFLPTNGRELGISP